MSRSSSGALDWCFQFSSAWSGSLDWRLVGSLEHREPHGHYLLHRYPAIRFSLGQNKLLSVGQADRDHHPPTGLELVDQWRWDEVGRRGDNHFVERGMLGPTRIAIPDSDFDVGVTLALELLHGSPREFIDDFDAVCVFRARKA